MLSSVSFQLTHVQLRWQRPLPHFFRCCKWRSFPGATCHALRWQCAAGYSGTANKSCHTSSCLGHQPITLCLSEMWSLDKVFGGLVFMHFKEGGFWKGQVLGGHVPNSPAKIPWPGLTKGALRPRFWPAVCPLCHVGGPKRQVRSEKKAVRLQASSCCWVRNKESVGHMFDYWLAKF